LGWEILSLDGVKDGDCDILERHIVRLVPREAGASSKFVSTVPVTAAYALRDASIHVFYPSTDCSSVQLLDSGKWASRNDEHAGFVVPAFVESRTLVYRSGDYGSDRICVDLSFDPHAATLGENGLAVSFMRRLGNGDGSSERDDQEPTDVAAVVRALPRRRQAQGLERHLSLSADAVVAAVGSEPFWAGADATPGASNERDGVRVLRLRGDLEASFGLVQHPDDSGQLDGAHPSAARDPLSYSFLELALRHPDGSAAFSVRREFTKLGEVMYAGMVSGQGSQSSPKPCPFAS
jgi:hypothetical protein